MKILIQKTNDIGEYIKNIRVNNKLTIEYVSKKSGYTSQTISNMEKNRGSVNVSTLLAVATVLGIKVELIFDNQNNIKLKGLH